VEAQGNIANRISKSLKTALWRKHARIEAENDNISESDLEDALRREFTLVEAYPDDPYGESALVLVFVDEQPVHVVLSPREEFCYLITVYVPEPAKWNESFTKRKGR
jgi:hypothetical protein